MHQPTQDQSTSSLINTLMRNPSNLFASLNSQAPTNAHASSRAPKHASTLVALFNPSLPTAEGYEHDKLLAFHPSTTPITRQVAIIGLWIALHEFAGTFAQPDNAVHAVETAQRSMVSTPLSDNDPQGPTLLLVAPTPLSVTLGTLGSWLRRLRAALKLVDDPSQAQSILDCFMARHPPPTAAHAAPPDAVPFLQPSQKTALSVQCLADSLQLYSLGGMCPVQHVLISLQGRCLYSSVGREDTAALHCCLAETLHGVTAKRPAGGHVDGYVVAT